MLFGVHAFYVVENYLSYQTRLNTRLNLTDMIDIPGLYTLISSCF